MAVFSQHHVDGLDLSSTPLLYMSRCFPVSHFPSLNLRNGAFNITLTNLFLCVCVGKHASFLVFWQYKTSSFHCLGEPPVVLFGWLPDNGYWYPWSLTSSGNLLYSTCPWWKSWIRRGVSLLCKCEGIFFDKGRIRFSAKLDPKACEEGCWGAN